ncbi:hypothetical protein QA601_03780 [Chitinispirillales bacterium ANBcel5]|uniref:hypothetical protein n=1 Tax=Cellulosispirillum alkaliphilum TaxID=3039283 RepID=UPI002A4FD926|nr:hypothetical protein [Chitinispirillales bacterium ANBcel5]
MFINNETLPERNVMYDPHNRPAKIIKEIGIALSLVLMSLLSGLSLVVLSLRKVNLKLKLKRKE